MSDNKGENANGSKKRYLVSVIREEWDHYDVKLEANDEDEAADIAYKLCVSLNFFGYDYEKRFDAKQIGEATDAYVTILEGGAEFRVREVYDISNEARVEGNEAQVDDQVGQEGDADIEVDGSGPACDDHN